MFFFFQKDLGPALFLCCVFLAVYAVARGRVGMAVTGLVLLAAGFYLGYRLQVSATLADRVRMWQSPWDNAVAGGDQVTHAIVGHGHRRHVRHRAWPRRLALSACRPHRPDPRGHRRRARRGRARRQSRCCSPCSRGAASASAGVAASDYGFFLATALTLFLIFPALIMASGVHGRHAADRRRHAVSQLRRLGHAGELRRARDCSPRSTPTAGPPTTSSRSACRCGISAPCSASARSRSLARRRPRPGRSAPTTTSSNRISAFTPTADGASNTTRGSLDIIRGHPARNDLRPAGPAARHRRRARARRCAARPTSARRLARQRVSQPGRAVLSRSAARRFTSSATRGRGQLDARRTRHTSSAMPTRGCAASTTTRPPSRRSTAPASRCTRSIATIASWCPLLRHRHQPDHPAVVAFRDRPRDVRLTIDAEPAAPRRRDRRKPGAQGARARRRPSCSIRIPARSSRAPAIPGRFLVGHAAIRRERGEDADVWLDRARYGAYPPGSTFKLVVALAALRDGRQRRTLHLRAPA